MTSSSAVGYAVRRIAIAAVLGLVLLAPCTTGAPIGTDAAYFVATDGDDANPGTSSKPFRTLDRARRAVRTRNQSMAADITVVVRAGEYRLGETLAFDSGDSGSNGFSVVYRAAPGEMAKITGGARITGWTQAGPGLFKAPVGPLTFRQLYVNGSRAVRARHPNEGYFLVRHWDVPRRRIEVQRSELPPVTRSRDVELNVHIQWTQSILRIADVATTRRKSYVIPAEPERTRFFSQRSPSRDRDEPYFLENAFEFLDEPGEWYLDAGPGVLYYRPRPGEEMATAAVVAPILETLIKFQGSLAEPVRNISLCGFIFEHTTWMVPSREGFIGDQAGTVFRSPPQADETLFYDGIRMPGGVHLEAAHGVRLVHNVFRHMGATAIQLYAATNENVVAGNVIADISGNGISVDMNLVGSPPDPREVSRNDRIENNLIIGVGRDYYGSVGIHAGYTAGLRIEHNEVTDVLYTGISVGWGWTDRTTALRDNVIAYNHVHGVMRRLADGAGIYTLSRQPGTRIEENHIHDLARAGTAGSYAIAGIYLDNGSDEITVRGNVVQDVPKAIHLNRVNKPPAGVNNVFVDNDGASPFVIRNAGPQVPYRERFEAIRRGGAAPFRPASGC